MSHFPFQANNSRWQSTLVALAFFCIALLLQNSLVPMTHWAAATLDFDAVMQSYLLSWGSRGLLAEPLNFYNPPVFFPDSHVAQSTDGLELPAWLMAPLWALMNNPYLLSNCLVVVAHFFAMAAAYFVARRQFALNRISAVTIAILFAVTGDRLWHSTGHFNLIWSGILPLVWYFTGRIFQRPGWRSASMLAIAFGSSIYFSVYFFVLSLICIGAALIAWMVSDRQWESRRSLLLFGVGLVGGCLLALPKIVIYAYAARGVETVRNTLAEAALYSANWAGYLLPTQPESGLARATGWGAEHGPFGENGQFLGYTLCFLLLCELARVSCRFYRREFSRVDKLSLASFALGLALVLCSFGPDYTILGISPYRLIYYPFLQFTAFFRVPARLAFVAQWLFLVSVCTFFSQFRISTNRWGGAAVAALILPLVYFEHVPLTHPPLVEKGGVDLLAAMDDRDPTHSQPYLDLRPDFDLRMALSNIPNWRPTANGWLHAALDPAFDRRALAFEEDFPSTGTIGWLATHGVPWVIVRKLELQRELKPDVRFELVEESKNAWLFRLRNLEKTYEEYQEFCAKTVSTLAALRAETPDSVEWPESSILRLRVVPEAAVSFDPVNDEIELSPGLSISSEGMTAFLASPPTYWFCLQPALPFRPGLYDRVAVEYELTGAPTKHRAHIFWGSEPVLKSTRRIKADVDSADRSDTRWLATFELSGSYNWMTDVMARWLIIEFDRFKGSAPGSIRITGVRLSRGGDSGRGIVVPRL